MPKAKRNETVSKKNVYLAVIMVLLMLAVFVPSVVSAVETPQQKTLKFMTDVAMLDLSKYNVTLVTDKITYPAEYGGLPKEEIGYEIKTPDSRCIVHGFYLNGSVKNYMIGWYNGSPMFSSSQPSNSFDYAKAVLQRYQTFVGSLHYQLLIDMIDSAKSTQSVTISLGAQNPAVSAWIVYAGAYELEVVQSTPTTIGFSWYYTANGAQQTVFGVVLQNGSLYTLVDSTSIFSFSDATVKVSESQAIDAAVTCALNFSWTTSDGQTAKADSVPRELASAMFQFYSSPNRSSFVFYPFWRVDLSLGKTYPGGVTFIDVGIWADTGIVEFIGAHGSGGGTVTNDSSTENNTYASPTQTPELSSSSAPTVSLEPSENPANTPSATTAKPSDSTNPTFQPETTPTPTGTPENGQVETSQFPLEYAIVAAVAVVVVAVLVAVLVKRRQK